MSLPITRMTIDSTTFYNIVADEYDRLMEQSVFYRNLREHEHGTLRKYVREVNGEGTAFDVGCGTGEYAIQLARMGYRTYALDRCRRMIQIAKSKAQKAGLRLIFWNCDVRGLKPSCRFDIIVAFGSFLNHGAEWEHTLALFGGLLKPNGYLLLDVDNLLGMDTVVLSMRNPVNSIMREKAKDLIRVLRSLIVHVTLESNWSFLVKHRILHLSLFYRSIADLEKIVSKNGFEIIEKRGVNILTSLLPWFLKSSAFISRSDQTPVEKALTRLCVWLDRGLGQMSVLRDLGANIILVAKKTS